MKGELGARISAAVRDATAAGNGLAVAAALNAIEPDELAEFFHERLAASDDVKPLSEGLPASPGATGGRIVLTADEAVTIPRSDVHYVVTEYGTAYLFGRSLRERAVALIELAHPSVREELLAAAVERGLVPPGRTTIRLALADRAGNGRAVRWRIVSRGR